MQKISFVSLLFLASCGIHPSSSQPKDMARSPSILGTIEPNGTIKGNFQDRTRVYGVYVDVNKGASILPVLIAKAGTTSSSIPAGNDLDTVIGVYGPVNGSSAPERMGEFENAAEAIRIERNGRYLVTFSSWDDPGNGSYSLKIECQGTDFQCRRPIVSRSCIEGTEYVEGTTISKDTTWNKCTTVILENLTIEPSAILSISPGVEVLGNFLGSGKYGNVALNVAGTIQAVGTDAQPIRFAGLKDAWKGISISGNDSTISHAYIEQAETGLLMDGQRNKLSFVNINSSLNGIRFLKNAKDNSISDLTVSGILTGTGIGAEACVGCATIDKASVSHFGFGVHLEKQSSLKILNSEIKEHSIGILVGSGQGQSLISSESCPPAPVSYFSTPTYAGFTVTEPGVWPSFSLANSRIIGNKEIGIFVASPYKVEVVSSRIQGNETGILLETPLLSKDSLFNDNDIVENKGAQVENYVTNIQPNFRRNFWGQISDPELSQLWKQSRTITAKCTMTSTYSWDSLKSYCSADGKTCGSYTACTYDASSSPRMTCKETLVPRKVLPLDYSGLSPERLVM